MKQAGAESGRKALQEAMALMAEGEAERARAGLQRLLEQEPENLQARHVHAGLLLQCGDLAGAESELRACLQRRPRDAPLHNSLGEVLRRLGRAEEALASFRRATRLDARCAPAFHNLGLLLHAEGRAGEAVAAFRRATELAPRSAKTLYSLGKALREAGAPAEAAGCWERAAGLADDRDLLLALGNTLRDADRLEASSASYRRILARHPDDAEARLHLRNNYMRTIPIWHFPMMNDLPRNRAYEAALARHVDGSTTVLDIGTGAGLLALMSARAGARHVYTCEMVDFIAEKARAVIAANGMADRITVIGARSNDVVVGRDLPRRADLLVTETFSSDLLSENIIETLAHAREHLLAPGARILPDRASVRGQVIGADDGGLLAQRFRVTQVSGFDLSAFNEFAPRLVEARAITEPCQALSDPADLLTFDLGGTLAPQARLTFEAGIRGNGRAVGVLQWIALQFSGSEPFENSPPNDGSSGWPNLVHTFTAPVEVRAGGTLALAVMHTSRSVLIDAA